MAQLIVRDLDERIVAALKTRAARSGRSAEAEHRKILEAVLGETDEMAAFARDAAKLRKRFSSPLDSTNLVREARDTLTG